MKIFISADMEGISGVVLKEQVSKGTAEYAEARILLTRDVNAVIEGALDGGATKIVVKDAHGSGFNFVLEELHPGAEYILGPSVPERFPELGEYDAMFLVGYHAKVGTAGAVRDHTMTSVCWQQFMLNGMELGEVGIDAAYAGAMGVPIALVTGDDKVCAEAQQLLGKIPVAVVKKGLNRHGAQILPPVVSRKLLREKACEAVKAIAKLKPFHVETPCEVRVRYTSTDMVDGARFDGDRVFRIDGQTIGYHGDSVLEVLKRSV